MNIHYLAGSWIIQVYGRLWKTQVHEQTESLWTE